MNGHITRQMGMIWVSPRNDTSCSPLPLSGLIQQTKNWWNFSYFSSADPEHMLQMGTCSVSALFTQACLLNTKGNSCLIVMLWVNSADHNFLILFLFFPRNRIWYFMQIVCTGDNLQEMPKPVFWEKLEKILICHLLKILPSKLSIKEVIIFIILRYFFPVLHKNVCCWYTRALEILKSESVQPMTMTSSMSPFPNKKYVYIPCHEN